MTGGTLTLRLKRLPHAEGLPLPEPATSGASGLDLRAALAASHTLAPGERFLVPTGLVLEIPRGWEGQIRPRSGLVRDSGVTVANAPGTIDSDYRGEVAVLLINLGTRPLCIERGERIAQLVITPVARVEWQEAEELEATSGGRGAGGFGSTGRK